MRLNELTGYKNHPAYQLGSRIRRAEPAFADENSYDMFTMVMFTNTIRNYGWRPIGAGKYSTVFAHSDYPFAVKVFVNDAGYEEYFNKVIRTNQGNPHVPQIRGKVRHIGKEAKFVRLEKLSPLSGEQDPILRKYIRPELRTNIDNLLAEENLEFLEKNWPELYDVFMDIFDMTTEIDWHDGNVMRRGNVLVVTDPIA